MTTCPLKGLHRVYVYVNWYWKLRLQLPLNHGFCKTFEDLALGVERVFKCIAISAPLQPSTVTDTIASTRLVLVVPREKISGKEKETMPRKK